MLAAFFYLFAFLLIAGSVSVVLARNPVNSVLLLVFTFLVSAMLFLMMGAELVAMLVLIVYVGAVAVLFLFVVMMLDIDYARLREGFIKYFFVGLLCAAVFFAGIVLMLDLSGGGSGVVQVTAANTDNVAAIARLLYTKYSYVLQLAAVLLLVAIVGTLSLTLRTRVGVRRQNVREQVGRSSAVALEKPAVGEGGEWKS